MTKYEFGLINSEGDIKRWRDVGKKVTVYSSFHAPQIGIDFQKFEGKIFIYRHRVYLCWGKYTACFSTETGNPILIKRKQNEPLRCEFLIYDETYKGRLNNSFQMIIDDDASVVYLIYREQRTAQRMIYTDRKSDISFITNGQIARDEVIGDGKNHSTYACIIKKGVPTFATSNGQPTFEPVTFTSVKAFKQGPYILFFNSEKERASVIDTRNGNIIRFTHAHEINHIGATVKGKKQTGKSSISIGDICQFEFNPDGSAYKVIHETTLFFKEKSREDILGDKTYWIDFSPGASIFLP